MLYCKYHVLDLRKAVGLTAGGFLHYNTGAQKDTAKNFATDESILPIQYIWKLSKYSDILAVDFVRLYVREHPDVGVAHIQVKKTEAVQLCHCRILSSNHISATI